MRTEKIHECGLFMVREDAAAYCGLSVSRFSELVAPNVPQYKIAPARGAMNQTIHYAKDDLDRWYQLFREHMIRSDPDVASAVERLERGKLLGEAKAALSPKHGALPRGERTALSTERIQSDWERAIELMKNNHRKKRKGTT